MNNKKTREMMNNMKTINKTINDRRIKMSMKMMSNMKTNVGTMNKIKEMMTRRMLLLDIFFNFSQVVHYFAYSKGGKVGHREFKIQLWRFLVSDWEKLQPEHLLRA